MAEFHSSFNVSQEVFMSSAKNCLAGDLERSNPSTSVTRSHSSAGATPTPYASACRCCTSSSGATATNSCSSHPPLESTARRSLLEIVSDDVYAAKAASFAVKIAPAIEPAAVHELFRQATAALGAEHAFFVSFIRDDASVSTCRFMVACDPNWCRRYLATGSVVHDPWLAYAAYRSEPILASSLPLTSPAQQQAIDLAAQCGFASAVLVPAHSGSGHCRVSLLCLGSSTPGFFECEGFGPLRVAARVLSLELHDWWITKVRRELLVRARVSEADLVLLRREHQGHSSKRIAAELHVSESSVNSRFQRMNAKLGVANRRLAAQLAFECGLIVG